MLFSLYECIVLYVKLTIPVKALPEDKQNQVIDQFLALPSQKKAIVESDKRDDWAADCYAAQRTSVS